jgi:DNA-binding transcriptional ArsR family regulator
MIMDEIELSTPGRRRALRALAARKRLNKQRLASGKNPIVEGKEVSPSSFASKTGMTKSKAKRLMKKGGKKRKKKVALPVAASETAIERLARLVELSRDE